MVDSDTKKCKHGNPHYCGICEAEAAPHCVHGNPFCCGHGEAKMISFHARIPHNTTDRGTAEEFGEANVLVTVDDGGVYDITVADLLVIEHGQTVEVTSLPKRAQNRLQQEAADRWANNQSDEKAEAILAGRMMP